MCPVLFNPFLKIIIERGWLFFWIKMKAIFPRYTLPRSDPKPIKSPIVEKTGARRSRQPYKIIVFIG